MLLPRTLTFKPLNMYFTNSQPLSMDLSMEELERRVEELIKLELEVPAQNPIDLITERTGYGKAFVQYVVEAVSLHYNDPKLLEHMV